MSCSTCGNRFPVSQSNPCSSCQQRQDSCDDAIQIAYVPGTACTIGITYNCVTTTLSLKEGIQNCETDTKLVWDPVSGCIQYHSERYVNQFEGATLQVVCASEIANAINLCELADVADTACDPNNCALFVYQKNTSCGENCKGVNDKWVPWTATEHKADYLTYVMGFNDEGCPIVLDKPNPTSDYWFAMWRGDGKFGYIKPANADLPKDGNGNTLVISQESNGKPIIGPIKEAQDLITITTARTSTVTEKPYYGQPDFDIRMDSREGNDGSKDTPDDMLCSVDWCTDYSGSSAVKRTYTVTVGPSGANFDDDYKRDYGRHFQQSTSDWAIPGHMDVVVPRGQHLKFHIEGVASDDDLASIRIHQVHVVWRRLHPYTEYRK